MIFFVLGILVIGILCYFLFFQDSGSAQKQTQQCNYGYGPANGPHTWNRTLTVSSLQSPVNIDTSKVRLVAQRPPILTWSNPETLPKSVHIINTGNTGKMVYNFKMSCKCS